MLAPNDRSCNAGKHVMAHATVNGTTLEYAESGHGEPIVLIHGSASDQRAWYLQTPVFAEQARVITYSRRFHWPNTAIPDGADYAMAEQVADLRAFLHERGASPAHLVGHSYGALVALTLAMESPEMVRSLVLAEPPVIGLFVSNPPTAWEVIKLLATRPRTAAAIITLAVTGLGPATAAAKRGDMDEAMRLFGMAAMGSARFGALSVERKAQVRANLFRAEFLGSGLPGIDVNQVRQLRIPTLLVSGQASPVVFQRLTDVLEKLVRNAERVEIPAASHLMQEDNALAFNTAVLAFVARHHA